MSTNKFTDEFKRDAVAQVVDRGYSVREVAERHGVPAHLLNGAEELIPAWLEGKQRVGITAGASAPEALVQGLVLAVKALGATSVRRLPGAEETIRFPLPKGLS